jgi:hypothetical protein
MLFLFLRIFCRYQLKKVKSFSPKNQFFPFLKLEMKKNLLLIIALFWAAFSLHAQPRPVFAFPAQDTALTGSIFRQALKTKSETIAALGKEHKDEYKEIYENRFEIVSDLFDEKKIMADHEANEYLQKILANILSGNKELCNLPIRLLFSKDWWPNAYSIGEGTLVVNAGLLVQLGNEAEVVSVICHELAHLYLDHGNKAIKKNVETFNSKEFREQLKKLSKQEYGAGAELDKLLMDMAFGSRRHSRANEAQADSQALVFLKNTIYDCHAILSCLGRLDTIDDRPLYDSLNLPEVFTFPDYVFRKKWISKESAIFGSMGAEDMYTLSKAERDSLKTHPDCTKRIALLKEEVNKMPHGKDFADGDRAFYKLKRRFVVEITDHLFDRNNYSRHLYYCLTLLKDTAFEPYAVYATARVLNRLFDAQKDHTLGKFTEKENRGYPEDYNLLLRMLDRVRLQELSELNYYFCLRYKDFMASYDGFSAEMEKARVNKMSFNN